MKLFKKLNTRGFAHIELFTAVLVIGLVVGIGGYVDAHDKTHAEAPNRTGVSSASPIGIPIPIASCVINAPLSILVGKSVTPSITVTNNSSEVVDTVVDVAEQSTSGSVNFSQIALPVPAHKAATFNGGTFVGVFGQTTQIHADSDDPIFNCYAHVNVYKTVNYVDPSL